MATPTGPSPKPDTGSKGSTPKLPPLKGLPPLRTPARKSPAEPPTPLPSLPEPADTLQVRPARKSAPTISVGGAATPPPLPVLPPPLPVTPPLPVMPPPLPVRPVGLDAASLLPGDLDPWSSFSGTSTRPQIAPIAASPPPLPHVPEPEFAPPPLPEPQTRTAPTMSEMGRIGKYELKQLIGEGGMGLVYKAQDAFLKREVALKVMKPEIASDERAFKLFITEAQATAALKDDRIATIYQIDEDQGQLYLAMELLRGESLECRLKRGGVSIETALWVVREAALGLAVAHRAGFTHRDIKPANLWLEAGDDFRPQADPLRQFREGSKRETQYLRVKILDFGLVRLGEDSDGKRRGDVVGTPAYMAPEQAAGKTADARSDIFSLGVVLFRLLTGRLPWEGETAMEIITAVASQSAPPPTKFNPEIPKALEELVMRMLARDPMARPGSASDVARLLEGIERFALAPPPPPRKSKRGLMLATAAAALAAGLFATYWFVLRDPGPTEDVPLVVPIASDGIISPQQAMNAIGEKVTVEFVVGAVRRSGETVYLYEKSPSDDETAFRVALPGPLIASVRRRGTLWPDNLMNARLRLTGVVLREGRFAEVLASDYDQFDKILYNDRPNDPPPKGKGED